MNTNAIYRKLAEKDKKFLWHPFTQMQDYVAAAPIIIERGEGIKLQDVQGRSYYDGVSSIWLNVHGHCVPDIDRAIIEQLGRIAHSTLLGLSSVPAIHLAEKLVSIAPDGLCKVFYSDSGSEAVEIGIKIAYQYWQLKGEPSRSSFIAMTNAYHGDTIGATSVGGIDLFHETYHDLMFAVHRVPYPHAYRYDGTIEQCTNHCLNRLRMLLDMKQREIAGLIVEPMVQGAAGMIMMPPGFMAQLRSICDEHNILLLADEVATGVGRTGRWFACDHDGISPDIMMMAKGLTGGYLPLAATLTTEDVYNAFLGDYSERKTFFHGHSYTGNQLGCAAALANLKLIEDTRLVESVSEKSQLLHDLLEPLRDHPNVGDIRKLGMMTGIELVRDKAGKEAFDWDEKIGIQVCIRSTELGMILRPLGNVIIFMPPLASTVADLTAMTKILQQAIGDVLPS